MSTILNQDKIQQLINYLASKVDIGKTKLMKLLYLIDFTAYERTGKAITGDEYEHLPFGPVPKNIFNNLDNLIKDVVEKKEEPRGYKYFKFLPKKKIDLLSFTQEEKEIIDEIIDKHGKKVQRELVRMVYEQLPCKITQVNETIPYFLAPYRDYRPLSEAKLKKLRADKQFINRIREAYKASKKSKSLDTAAA